MQREYKEFQIEAVKALNDAEMQIEGYASVYGNVDQGNDVVVKGAFNNQFNKSRKPKMLMHHDTKQVIGVWDEVVETEKGLYIKGRFADITDGVNAYKLAKMGAIDGLSIGFSIPAGGVERKGNVRHIKQAHLYEVSLVTFPMNEEARVSGVKSQLPSEREFEQVMQDAGLSRSQARIVLNQGYKSLLSMQDAGDEGMEQLKAALTKNINTLTN